RVTRHAVAIGGGADPTVRLDFEGKDEIAVLAREFDRMVEHVVRLGYCDSLTGLANREQAHLRLDSALAAAHRQGRPLALMYVDLDNFKRINDTLGHGIGDEVLVTAAERPCSALRSAAKRRAPGSYAFFDVSMNEGVLQRYTIESKLRGALERGELSLHYQPQISLSTSEVTGMEALLRWTHPELGVVPPSEFIPIAEASG